MASDYLEQKKREIRNKYDILIRQEEDRALERKREINDAMISFESACGGGALICGAIGLFMGGCGGIFGGICVGAVIGILLVMWSAGDADKKRQEDESASKKIIQNINQKCAQEITEEEQKFKEECLAYAKKYINSPNIGQVVEWLYTYVKKKIAAADRSAYLQEIEVPFMFSVLSHCVDSEFAKFDFTTNIFKHFTSMSQQVGFAEALTKLLYVKIMKYNKQDVSGTTAKVSVSHNDANVTMKYIAKNGYFCHPKSF